MRQDLLLNKRAWDNFIICICTMLGQNIGHFGPIPRTMYRLLCKTYGHNAPQESILETDMCAVIREAFQPRVGR